MSNEEKSKQLGMPFGTANAKLRKAILFHLVTKYNENNCYRCNKIIEDIDNFSIEHKENWFGKSTDLFWDINNISFSHLSCNVSASNHRKYPIGYQKCYICKILQKSDMFYRNNNTCKPCDIKRNDTYRRSKGIRPTEPKFLRGSKYAGDR